MRAAKGKTMIKFACPNCSGLISVDEKDSGKKGKCPKCGGLVLVPERSTVIEFPCGSCAHKISVPQIHAGKKGKCPRCKRPVVVPSVKRHPKSTQAPVEENHRSIFRISVACVVLGLITVGIVFLLSGKADANPVEMLRQIPGPVFLAFFIPLVGTCFVIAWLWVNADGTSQYPLPELTRFDPFAIAALRGGSAAVIRAAVFSLWSQKLVEISVSESSLTRKRVEVTSRGHKLRGVLSPIEFEIHRFLQRSREPRDLFKEASLKGRIEAHLESVYREFEETHLVPTGRQKAHAWLAVIMIASVIVVVGGTKLHLGLTSNKPALFLCILFVGSLFSLAAIVDYWRWTTITQLGRSYLKALEEHYDWLKEPADLDENPEGIDPTLSIAVFGISALGGAAMYEAFRAAFPLSKAGGGILSGGGGCGGGGGGGGCSGGGGGGCGGGGGGCGGCGG